MRNIFFTLSYPFQKVFSFLGDTTTNTFEFLGSISSLKSENVRLIKENNELLSQVVELKSEKEENKLLREQLRLIPKNDYNLEASFTIGQDPQKLGSWIMIDKGYVSGIRNGMPVIVSNGILVGKITEVYEASSKVSLLTDAASSINAMDLETSSKGIIKGEYGLGIIMDMVAQTDVLNVGDTIISSGLGGNTPKGLYIGTVREVKTSSDKLFQQALIIPRVKYSKLDLVFVVK